ncbi:uncharacterized protein KQ657_002098 [Scheffersomyces spartinae]|uniref:Ras GTPase-activating-like protein n=1 Tax=Scheffersomyces spartinae TaxID=45513 RepID=A0A9P7VCT2_9ASCO|nr:uncharacterized protein KQ657_002098 [Scheffersomyces spartinae]KAG7195715.1 hypothetical protein KQ657_002098 [Scheffersomyces spartinae]
MASPTRSNGVAQRYLVNLNEVGGNSSRKQNALQPSSKLNAGQFKNDLDKLAADMNITTPSSKTTASSTTTLLRSRFESPSVTVSSFKSSSTKSSTSPFSNSSSPTKYNSSNNNKTPTPRLPIKLDDSDEKPSWATANYKDVLSRNKTPRLSPSKIPSLGNPLESTPSSTSPAPRRSPYLTSPSNSTSTDLPGYEYLCRIQAIKDWLELVLQEQIDLSPVEMIAYIKNGIHLAKLSNVFLPLKRRVFLVDGKLQFKHTENINIFFQLLDYLNIPDLFRFELTDLYDAKNVPKVWFCLHALSFIINNMFPEYPPVAVLVGKLLFLEEEIRQSNRSLVGVGLPNFTSADSGADPSIQQYNSQLKFIPRPLKRPELSPEPKPTLSFVNASPQLKARILVEQAMQTEDNPFLETTSILRGKTLLEPPLGSDFIRRPKQQSSIAIDTSDLEQEQEQEQENVSASIKSNASALGELQSHEAKIIKLQSLARGANFRYNMFVDRILLKSYGEEFTHFQSIIRGKFSRDKSVHKHRDHLLLYKDEITELQSLIRAKLTIKRRNTIMNKAAIHDDLQSIIRGHMVRRKLASLKESIRKQQPSIIELQNKIRTKTVSCKVVPVLHSMDEILPSVIRLQSHSRLLIYRRGAALKISGFEAIESTTKLQSYIRGFKVRMNVRKMRTAVEGEVNTIKELQSIAKGAISRTRLFDNVLVSLLYEDFIMNGLFSKIRGNKVRKDIQIKKFQLERCKKESIVPIQSLFRGLYCRFQRDIMLEDVYDEIDSIISLQALIRARPIKKLMEDFRLHYQKNYDKVVKAQAIIKAKITRDAYKTLMTKKNCPFPVIKRFAHLLSTNEADYVEEMALNEQKDKVIELSKKNDNLEMNIENLDLKLSLLDKNKITIEQFIKERNKFKMVQPTHSNLNLDNMDKSSRERIELYQSLFFLLQTKPTYLANFYRNLSLESRTTTLVTDLTHCVNMIFPITNNNINAQTREEYYLMKLMFCIISDDIEFRCKNIGDITKMQSCYWLDLFLLYNRHTSQRHHLKKMIGNFVQGIVERSELDYESDPSLINDNIVDRDLRLLGSSTHKKGISPHMAIKDPEISNQFVENLLSLREAASLLTNILESSMSSVPRHVKLVAKKAYKLSQLNFPEKSNTQHLAVAGVIFIKHYVSPILHYPENFGILDSRNPVHNDTNTRANLKHLSRVMLQLFSMKQFTDNFLKPLNDYVDSTTELIKSIIETLISVNDLDDEYNMNDYDDIVVHSKPVLSLKTSDMFKLEKMILENVDIVVPSEDDQLLGVLKKLQSLSYSSDQYIRFAELGLVTLNLNPTSKEESLIDAKSRSLFTQAKRYLLNIIMVQDEPTLLETLVAGISKEHEFKFKQLIEEQKQESNNNNRLHATYLSELNSISFHDLKKKCLEILLKLEQMGQLSRRNSFQDLLNQIAMDIKTKDSQRINRKQQLTTVSRAIFKLSEKEKYLTKQLEDYNNHIEQLLGQLQSIPKDKKIFNIIPVFSKQYFYHRELRKSNRLPKFGSYKYSAKKLQDQHILLDVKGLLGKAMCSSSKLDFMFSCHEVGKFTIEAANGSINVQGACERISLDDFLNMQYDQKETVTIFSGMALFNTQNLCNFIFRKFYDIKE